MTYTAELHQPTSVMELSLEVFGVMRARRGSEQVRLGPPRHRAVLGLLLLRLGQVVPADQLIDELWGGRPPRRPQATLQTYLSHLRRVLTWGRGPEKTAAPLHYRAPGYVLTLEPEAIDIFRFDRLVSRGQRQMSDGHPEAARDALHEALTLWQADPYLDLTAYTPLAEESTRLQHLRTTAAAVHAEALLTLGRASDAVAELRREVNRNPTDERMVADLMTGLYRLGRQAEALRLYDRTRTHLSEELGVAPGLELQGVHLALLRHELGDRGTAAHPEAHTRPDAGARTAGRGEPPAGQAAFGQRDGGTGGPEEVRRDAAPGASSVFPGREHSLAALRSFIAGALRGSGHLTAVVGEAGVGKTELVARATAGDEPPAVQPEVIRVSCRSTRGMPTDWVWQEVVRRLGALRGESCEDIRGECMLTRQTTLSGQEEGPVGHSATELHFRAHDALCETILRCADQRALLLVLDDAHRADQHTLDVLGLLTSRTQGRPLSVVITAREPGLGAGPEPDGPLVELLADSRTKVVHLDGLSEEHVRTVITAQAGPGVDSAVVRALYERSAGNPYLLGQLLVQVGGAQRLHDPRTADVLRTEVPTGVRNMLHQRISGLPSRVVRILRACAVLGAQSDLTTLTRVLDGGETDHEVLEEALRTGLLDRDHPHRLVLRHGIVQDVLLAEMSRRERAALHARAVSVLGARLDSRPLTTEHLARHAWQAALALPTEDVVPYLLRAGKQAASEGSYEHARTWFHRAHTLLSDLGDGAAASEQALELRTRILQLVTVTRGYGDHEVEAEARRMLELPATTLGPAKQSALLLHQVVAELVTGRSPEGSRHIEQLSALAERSGDPEVRFYERLTHGMLRLPSETADALTALTEAERTAESLPSALRDALTHHSHHDPRFLAMNHRVLTLWLLGATDEALALGDELLRATARDGTPVDRASAHYFHALVAALSEDPHTAAVSSEHGLDIARAHGLTHWIAMLRVCHGWARQQTGATDALASLESTVTELRERRLLIRMPLHLGLLAHAQHSSGAIEAARETLRSSVAEIRSRGEQAYVSSRLPFNRLPHLRPTPW